MAKRGRPKKDWRDDRGTVLSFVMLSQRPGWEKISACVSEVARRHNCSVPTVWRRLRSGETRLWAEIELEDRQYDAMLDAAYDAERESAMASLVEEHGEREFTTEEIEDRIEEIRADYADFDWADLDDPP